VSRRTRRSTNRQPRITAEDFTDRDMVVLSSEPPHCPYHPEVMLRPVPSLPLLFECLYGCTHALVPEDNVMRHALISVWAD
jgi:hypothetical protein